MLFGDTMVPNRFRVLGFRGLGFRVLFGDTMVPNRFRV